MWSLQEVIDRVKESEKFKAVRELYRDVELEPGELQGMEAIFVKILGRCVATVEIPRDSEPFSYLHWGSNYEVFSREVRKMYSLQSLNSGKMLEFLKGTQTGKCILDMAVEAVVKVFKEILKDGIGIVKYTYEKTGETHEPTGMAVYLVINGGRLTGVRVLAPCFDARGIEWLSNRNIHIGLGVYLPRESEIMLDVRVAWDEGVARDRELHILGSARRGAYLTSSGGEVGAEVTINHGGENYSSLYNPNFGDLKLYGGARVDTVYTCTGGYRPVVKSHTTIKNLRVYTHAPTFPSGIEVTGGYGLDTGTCPTSHLVERNDEYGEWELERIPHYRTIQEDMRYLTMGPVGSESGTMTAVLADDGVIYVTRGCFEGTLEDFREAVEETHKHEDSQFYREYLAIIEVIKARFPTGREHGRDSDK